MANVINNKKNELIFKKIVYILGVCEFYVKEGTQC